MSRHDPDIRLPLTGDGPLDPPAEWQRLRERCPMATAELPSGDKATYLTRYDDVKSLLSDARFSRPTATDNAARIAPDGAGGPAANGDTSLAIPDRGEPHQRWRRQVGKYLTAKRMTTLRPGMVSIAESLVEDMVEHGQPADLKAAVGFPFPVFVICDLLGVPAEDRGRFSYWSDAFLNVARYTTDETRGVALLIAGHETTANMIGKMVSMLLADRTRWERLLADPTLVRTAVDEALRWNAVVGIRELRDPLQGLPTPGPHSRPGLVSLWSAGPVVHGR